MVSEQSEESGDKHCIPHGPASPSSPIGAGLSSTFQKVNSLGRGRIEVITGERHSVKNNLRMYSRGFSAT